MLNGVELDIYILMSIFKAGKAGRDITTWEIAKNYSWNDKPTFLLASQKSRYYVKKTGIVNYRMKTMAKEGFVRIEKEEGKTIYNIIGDKIFKMYFIEGKRAYYLSLKNNSGKRVLLEI